MNFNPFESEITRMSGPYEWTQGNSTRRSLMFELANGRKTSMPFARWMMTQHLGRKLSKSEHVDHIDEDPLNDDIGNLQLLTPRENARKHARLKKPTEWAYFQCPICGKPSKKKARFVRHNRNMKKSGPFCGRGCAGKASHLDEVFAPNLRYEIHASVM